MIEEKILREIQEVFYEVRPDIFFDQLDLEKPLQEQVEIDSFDFYLMLLKLSKKTGITIPDSKYHEFHNLEELIHFLIEQIASHDLRD